MARWFVDRSAQRGIPSVSLRRLLPEATFVGVSDLEVSACSTDTRRLDPGQVFIALRGRRHDGHQFVGLALERGASAVVVERPCPEAGRLQVIVPDSRRAFARISHALAGDPSSTIAVLGVTGTSGASAASRFLQAILEADGRRVGRLDDGNASILPNPATEPNAEALADQLGRLVDRRHETAVLNLSHDQLFRADADGLSLAGALTVGVRAPMLDRASTFAARKAQARLFQRIAPGGIAVVRADDPDADLLGAVNLEARRVSFALEGPADVTARIERFDRQGTRFLLRGFDREATVQLHPIGRRALAAALAASAMAGARGAGVDAVVAGLESVTRLPGRLEALGLLDGSGLTLHHDQARSGPELAEALAALRESGARRVLCLLAVSEDRASLARLGQAAESGADLVMATLAESFRGDPDVAIDRLLAGFRRPGRVRVEPQAHHAISLLRPLARPGDALLLAGSFSPAFLRGASRPVERLRRSA